MDRLDLQTDVVTQVDTKRQTDIGSNEKERQTEIQRKRPAIKLVDQQIYSQKQGRTETGRQAKQAVEETVKDRIAELRESEEA